MIPAELVDRMIDGENKLRVWREHRGISAKESILAVTALLAGCGFVHDERFDGPYRLNAIDIDSQTSVCYDLGDSNCIGRISETVFAVGWNGAYLVAARHPHSDKSKVEYF